MQNTHQQPSEVPQAGKRTSSISSEDIKLAIESFTAAGNKTLNASSFTTGFDDYLKKAAERNTGIPSGYKQDAITKEMMAKAWAARSYPGKAGQGSDSQGN
ncbi:uncharacterized protein TRIVIDRAFT_228656 [Trichoderma virens Gv29-8]|uniref:Uncharacterized protein n=1 Tax=Hypocrea virens (strain Gv29-8 / FGSC 10586) TaxID=413071 RepID=G9ND61_HYPVG|nr:uncharacterized protein TRIVIDRAFT_228656 [Trichoderma virens Gv29-8]EHK15630.1 hypothetical protein TRIVIDRAFT_228656 [Trichoderma virens Gv29-8]UKZ51574.1 hypothetical protein TrVGV298_005334 [Trichoderma virens]UKZ77397.1 hypothetical protein TrVFT333_005117 [Trichoderma virens FT-333]